MLAFVVINVGITAARAADRIYAFVFLISVEHELCNIC